MYCIVHCHKPASDHINPSISLISINQPVANPILSFFLVIAQETRQYLIWDRDGTEETVDHVTTSLFEAAERDEPSRGRSKSRKKGKKVKQAKKDAGKSKKKRKASSSSSESDNSDSSSKSSDSTSSSQARQELSCRHAHTLSRLQIITS